MITNSIELKFGQSKFEDSLDKKPGITHIPLSDKSLLKINSLDLDDILDSFIENLNRFVTFDTAAVIMKKNHHAEISRSSGFSEIGLGNFNQTFRINSSKRDELDLLFRNIQYKLLNGKKPHLIWGLNKNFSWVRSSLCLPIGSNCMPVGYLVIDSKDLNAFNELTTSDLRDYVNYVSASLNNARQYEQIERQMMQLRALQGIDQAINSSLDLNISLEIVITKIMQQLNPDAIDILLVNPVTHNLNYKAGYGFRSHEHEHQYLVIGTDLSREAVLERRISAIGNIQEERIQTIRTNLIDTEKFISYFCAPMIAKGQVIGVIELFFRRFFESEDDWLEFLSILANQTAIAVNNSQLYFSLQRSNIELENSINATIEGWVNTLDLRDKETEGHSQRVTEITVKIAQVLGYTNGELTAIQRGALLHDIGKVGIPDEVLLKKTPLTTAEWETMKMHPIYAYQVLSKSIHLRNVVDIPYCHHEKWDGTGYPRGLKGAEIPMAARIFAIVDQWDALTSDRPYRKAWSEAKTLHHIKELKGVHFDPYIVQIFMENLDGIVK